MPLYAISPQNEPRFKEGYNSCEYTIQEYQTLLKALGPKLKAASPTTIISASEDMLSWWDQYLKSILSDSVCMSYVDAISVHGYSDGISPLDQRTALQQWAALWKYASGFNPARKKLMVWQTETSGYDNQWENGPMVTWDGQSVPNAPGGLSLATDILCALKYGHISMWNYWRCTYQTYYYVLDNGTYQASVLFYKFIRPGAVNIESDQDVTDSTLFDVAFNDKKNQKLVIVLSNVSTTAKTVSIAGNAIPDQFAVYRSSATESYSPNSPCTPVATMSRTSITLPGHSVSTLVGSGYSSKVINRGSPLTTVSRTGVIRCFGIDGKEYKGAAINRSHGVRFMVSGDNNGKIAATKMIVKL